jgi:hypothetical protein
MGVVERIEHASHQPQCRCRLHRRAERVAECGSVLDILEHQIQHTILLAVVVDRQDVGVLEVSDRARLALEALGELRVVVILQ